MLVRGARWHYVIRSLGIEYGLRRATVWAIGFFASSVTPAKAGDVVRAVYLRNDTGRPWARRSSPSSSTGSGTSASSSRRGS